MNLFSKHRLNFKHSIRYFILNRSICDESEIRVRFAPSPTGFLHLGGLRTALYNFLFAKSNNGKFVLRIEDTDQTRLVKGAVEKLEYDLEWAGITPDESPSKSGSYGPYIQSERLSLYSNEVKKLLKNGTAYYCFCNDRRLDLLKRDAIRRREVPKYDNRCRHLTDEEIRLKLNAGSSYCIRFKLSTLVEPIEDLVYGHVGHNVAAVEGDPIIIKSDGFPTYHFANVVDDHHMKISHVLRGVEWQQSTAKHLLIYKALDWIPPKFAHLPLLMNADGTKLSKRNSNMTVEAYRNDGIYPIALLNFIVSSGGGFLKDDNRSEECKIKHLHELIQRFQLSLVNSHNCQVQHDRLNEFNRLALQILISNETSLDTATKEVKNMIEQHFAETNKAVLSLDDKKIKEIIKWSSVRTSRLKDLLQPEFSYLWILPSEEILLKGEVENFQILNPLIHDLKKVDNFNELSFSNYFKSFAQKYKMNYASLMKFLRTCLSGLSKGPSVGEIMIYLGKESVLQRLERAELLYRKKYQ